MISRFGMDRSVQNKTIKSLSNFFFQKELSIYKLESLTGVYTSTISQFLTRKTKTIRIENLLYICEGLGTNLSEFFSDSRFDEAEAKGWLKRT